MSMQIKLTREELHDKIWKTPASELAKQFHISDVALGKICRKMNVPKPPRGYWERLRAGESIPQTPLPKTNELTRDFTILYIPNIVEVPAEIQALIDDAFLDAKHTKLAENLDDLHPLVQKARAYFEKVTPESNGLVSLPKEKGFINLTVSASQSTRALLVLDALLRALENRGYTIVVSRDHWGEETRIVKEGESVFISVYEKSREIKPELTPEQKKKPPYLLNLPAQFQPDGKLHVKINERYGSYRRIADRQNDPVENRLNEIVSDVIFLLETRVVEKRKREEEERQRQEAIRRREEEKKRRELLEREADEWHKSQDIRHYLAVFEARLRDADKLTPEYKERLSWLEWARNYADSIDPLNKHFPSEEAES